MDLASLELLPQVPLEAMEPAVRAQFETLFALLEEARESGELSQLAAAYSELGQSFHAYDLLEPATLAYENARRLDFDAARWTYLLASIAEERGELQRALALVERVLELQPERVPVLVARGRLLSAAGRPAQARESLVRALELESTNAGALFELARLEMEAGDAKAAAARYRRILELQPRASIVHYPLAQAYRALGALERAREHLARRGPERFAAADPWREEMEAHAMGATAQLARGGFAWREGRYEDAALEYRLAVAADPGNVTARRDLAFALVEAGQADAALEELLAAITLEPESAVLHHAVGVLELRAGRGERALEALQRAVDLDPGEQNARFELARVLIGLGRREEAVEDLSRVLAIDPHQLAARRLSATLLAELGRLPEAKEELARAVATAPEDLQQRAELARLALHLNDRKTALEQYRVLADAGYRGMPETELYAILADLLLAAGEREAAAEAARRSRAAIPE